MSIQPYSKDFIQSGENQQTNYNPEDAIRNAAANVNAGASFDPQSNDGDTDKAVIIVGGGSAAALDEMIEKHGGRENVLIVLAGSAAMRLNREAQEKAGYPFVESADAVVLNGVDGADEGTSKFTQGIAEAVGMHSGIDVYLSDTNAPEAFVLMPQAVKVDVSNPHVERGDSLSVGLGSTAPTAAAKIFMLKGYKNFAFVGVDGATPEPIQVREGGFNAAASELPEAKRYLEYEIGNEAWDQIPAGNSVFMDVNGMRAKMPSGQVYTLEELARMKIHGREQGVSFEFSGKTSMMSLVLDQGHEAVLVRDTRDEQNLTSGSQRILGKGFVISANPRWDSPSERPVV